MPLGSIPETRTRPSRMAGAMDTSGHHITEFLPAPVAPAVRVWPPASGTGSQSWPYSVRPDHTRRRSIASPATRHEVGEVAGRPRGRAAGCGAGNRSRPRWGPVRGPGSGPRHGRGQRPGGRVEVLGFLAGHQPHPDLVPRGAGAHPDDARELVAARSGLGLHSGAPERRDLHRHRLTGVGHDEPARAQPARHPRRVDDPALPPRAQPSPDVRLERQAKPPPPHRQHHRDDHDSDDEGEPAEPVQPGRTAPRP